MSLCHEIRLMRLLLVESRRLHGLDMSNARLHRHPLFLLPPTYDLFLRRAQRYCYLSSKAMTLLFRICPLRDLTCGDDGSRGFGGVSTLDGSSRCFTRYSNTAMLDYIVRQPF